MIDASAAPFYALAIGAAFVLGWFLALRLIRSNAEARTAVFDAEILRHREDSRAALATVGAYADARISDAQKHVAVMDQAANVLLKAARTERAAADALEAASAQGKRAEEALGLLRQTCESIDAQQGAILTALLNSGLMQGADIQRNRGRQVGEPDMNNPPPLVERDLGKPLDTMLR